MAGTKLIRASEEEIERWSAAAEGARSFNSWAVGVLNRAVGVEVAVAEPRSQRAARPKRGECSRARHHRPGSFCKECGSSG